MRPGNLQRLALLPRFYDRAGEISIDQDRPLGELNGDEPLIADPAQAVLVLMFAEGCDPCTLLVMRMQALGEQTNQTCTDFSVPWNEWGATLW